MRLIFSAFKEFQGLANDYSLFRGLKKTLARLVTLGTSWLPAYSLLVPVVDSDNWVLQQEMREVTALARGFGITTCRGKVGKFFPKQSIFFFSQFFLLDDDWKNLEGRIATAYFHGLPGTGCEEFDRVYDGLKKNHHLIHRVQVSHSQIHDLVLESGISPEKVFRIPIGINPSLFSPQTPESKHHARRKLGLPNSAMIIGSFQKDGEGWGDGLQPKRIKGPDVFLQTVRILKERIPELFILLSGPARGYVKRGLENIGVQYSHRFLDEYSEIDEFYQAVDAYVVSSRQEGGPKAILEAMACRVPIITTRVGQAMDLVRHEENGWLVEPEDAEGLAFYTCQALASPLKTKRVLEAGLLTVAQNSYTVQIPLWKKFFAGFVRAKRIR